MLGAAKALSGGRGEGVIGRPVHNGAVICVSVGVAVSQLGLPRLLFLELTRTYLGSSTGCVLQFMRYEGLTMPHPYKLTLGREF